ncbi:hypothetical protein DB347_21250 [Opitutaceae bacterium EW11]|nr:hypothetical protein DB347_21250 [Opitutaceae bacterium EW11]
MKPETLKSLIVDRALGELPPDVGELLDAYLENHPDLAAQAERTGKTTGLARAAMRVPAPSGTPSALPRWKAPDSVFNGAARRLWLPLAASVTVGFLAGRFAAPRENGSAPMPQPPDLASSASVLARLPTQGTSALWTVPQPSRAGVQNPVTSDQPYRLRWDSPVKLPHLEEKQ